MLVFASALGGSSGAAWAMTSLGPLPRPLERRPHPRFLPTATGWPTCSATGKPIDRPGGCQRQRVAGTTGRGADFYMQPAWHPDGTHLAWIEWDHPNMPWDGTRLMLARLSGSRRAWMRSARGWRPDTPVFQPIFAGWALAEPISSAMANGTVWNCWFSWSGEKPAGARRWFPPGPAGLGAGHAHLRLEPHQPAAFIYRASYAGLASLWMVDLESGHSSQIDTAPYTWLQQLAVSPAQRRAGHDLASAPGYLTGWCVGMGSACTLSAAASRRTSPGVLAHAHPI